MIHFFYYLYLPQLFINSEHRECEHRTYIVKEQYDRLKSSMSLSTLKKQIGTRRIAGDMGGDHDAGS